MVSIGDILNQWDSIGVFAYLLPFLLLFAIVFGILQATHIMGKNRGLMAIIAIAVGLLALQNNDVTQFFQELFPRLGVGLAVLLAVMILFGMFIPDKDRRYWYWGLGAIAFIVFIVVLSKSFENYGWYDSFVINDWIGYIVGAVLLVGIIIAVAAGSSDNKSDGKGELADFTVHRN